MVELATSSPATSNRAMAHRATAYRATAYRGRWKWYLATGLVLLLLGLASAGATGMLQVASLVIFGPLLLASSLLQFFTAFLAEDGRRRYLRYLAAGLEAVLGFVIMAQPIVVVTDMAVLVAILVMFIGLTRLADAVLAHAPQRPWLLMVGGAVWCWDCFSGSNCRLATYGSSHCALPSTSSATA